MDPNSANIQAISALRQMRAAMAIYGERAGDSLYEVQSQIARVIEWLIQDRPAYWKNEVRKSYDLVARARSELERCYAKTMGGDRPSCIEEKKALQKAQAWLRHCEDQIEVTKKWIRVVQHESAEYEGRITPLSTMLQSDLPRTLAVLERMAEALEDYVNMAPQSPDTMGEGLAGLGGGGMARGGMGSGRAAPTGWESLSQRLRFRAPTKDMRAAVGLPALSAESSPADSSLAKPPESAVQLAAETHCELSWPAAGEKVVAAAGWRDTDAVYLVRLADADGGDSGWFVGPVEPAAEGVEPQEGLRVAELLSARPALAGACGLPGGWLARYGAGGLEAVENDERREVWPPASG